MLDDLDPQIANGDGRSTVDVDGIEIDGAAKLESDSHDYGFEMDG